MSATEASDAAESDITLLVADDHPITREGLALLLDSQPGLKVVAQAGDGREAVRQFARARPDVSILDLQMPTLSGLGAAEEILRLDRDARIVLLTTFDGDEDVYRGMHIGAKAYLLKESTTEEVLRAIRAVHAGRRYLPTDLGAKLADRVRSDALTQRELDVLREIAHGLANKEIAARLGIAEGTVKSHVNAVMSKLRAASRTEAALAALRRGLLRP